jgi:hypothetical protein
MYQTDFVCTYKLMESPEEEEELYRIQLLQAFNIERWDNQFDDKVINDMIENLHSILSKCDDFQTIINKARQSKEIVEVLTRAGLSTDDDNIIFKMLFIFEYFDLLHRCICDYFSSGSILPAHLDRLLNVL